MDSPPRLVHVGIGVHQPGEATYRRWATACLHLHRYPGEFVFDSGHYVADQWAITSNAVLETFTHRWSQRDSAHITLHYLPAVGKARRWLAPFEIREDFEELWTGLAAAIPWQTTEPSRAQARIWDVLWELSTPLEGRRDPSPFDLALALANRNPSATVEEICLQTGLSLYQINARSEAISGTSFKQLLLRQRLDRAQELLRSTNLPLKAIAHSLGYTDPHAFNKDFRKRVGLSPRDFRHGGKFESTRLS